MDSVTLLHSFKNATISQNRTLVLTEHGDQATLRKITIENLPNDTFAIKIDKFKVQNVFNQEKEWGYNKHGDYVIVTKDILIFIEMKSTNCLSQDRNKKIITKFQSDTCIIDYFDTLFKRMLGKNHFFSKREKRFVALYRGPEIKPTTSMKPQPPTHVRPESFAKIAVKDDDIVDFRRLCIGH